MCSQSTASTDPDSTTAAEASRVSEPFVRGQLDALVDTLGQLAREANPTKFLEHVCHVTCEQLGAVGLARWELSNGTAAFKLIASYLEGRLHLPTPAEMHLSRAPGASESHPVWGEIFTNPEARAYARVARNPLRAQITLLPDGAWHDTLRALAENSVMERRLDQLSAKGIVGSLIIPSVVSGKVSGCYFIWFKEHREFRPEEIGLTRAMLHLASFAHQLYRLLEESREAAAMSERNRLARDIHDTLAQGFTGVIMQLEAAKGAIQREDWPRVDEHVERANAQARASLGDARRSVVSLRPHSVRDGHLRNSLEELMRRLTDGSQVRTTLSVEGQERHLALDWEDNLLRIAQEALNNTLKYAKATAFRATLRYLSDRTELHLADNGQGFDIGESHDGYGLIGMRERVNGMNGQFSLKSATGNGTEIQIVLELNPT